MNVLFDLSLPENRRTKKRAQKWESVPEEFRPRCIICNEPIPFGSDTNVNHWMARKICTQRQDTKEIKCYSLYIKMHNAARQRVPGTEKKKPRPTAHWKKPAAEQPKPREVMPQEVADRLDAEQCRINIECHKRTMERCGYTSSPCRSLTPEEIEAIRHTITPIDMAKPIVEQFRPWIQRGHSPC